MKKPEEIKKGLECCANSSYCDEKCPYFEECNEGLESHASDALALIQQLEAQVPRWIPVEERLPEDGEKVIVRGVRDGIQTGTYKGHSAVDKHVWWWKHNTYLKVAYWMPESMLPEAPKEEINEQANHD